MDEQQFALFIGGLVHRVEIEEMRNLLYQVVDDRRLHQRLSAARLFPCLWEAMGCGKKFRGEEVRWKRAFIELIDAHGVCIIRDALGGEVEPNSWAANSSRWRCDRECYVDV